MLFASALLAPKHQFGRPLVRTTWAHDSISMTVSRLSRAWLPYLGNADPPKTASHGYGPQTDTIPYEGLLVLRICMGFSMHASTDIPLLSLAVNA
jgi:hypothetical protein